jgi:hypothetical protein
MMTGMSECLGLRTGGQMVAAEHACLNVHGIERPHVEVVMRKTLSVVVAAALVAALLVGGVLMGAKNGAKTGTVPRAVRSEGGEATRSGGLSAVSARAGLMPEVVVRAEMPRLVMPTVEVRAYRTLAMSASGSNVY